MKKILIMVTLAFCIVGCQGNNSSSFENDLEEVGKKYYEEFYYDLITFGTSDDDLKGVFEEGNTKEIKISAESILNVSEIEFGDLKDDLENNSSCDLTKSTIELTAEEPYAKTDYSIKVNAKCE